MLDRSRLVTSADPHEETQVGLAFGCGERGEDLQPGGLERAAEFADIDGGRGGKRVEHTALIHDVAVDLEVHRAVSSGKTRTADIENRVNDGLPQGVSIGQGCHAKRQRPAG